MRQRLLQTMLMGLLLVGCGAEGPAHSDVATRQAALGTWTRVNLGIDQAMGVNDRGLIVGQIKGMGAWWYHGTWKALPAPPQPWLSYSAYNVSYDNRIVGAALVGTSKWRALYWPTTTAAPIDLGDIGGGSSQALDINKLGVAVGVSLHPGDSEWHAVRFDPVAGPVDINPPGYLSSTALRINDKGVIVGFADSTTPQLHRDAIRWNTDGTITYLQTTTGPDHSGAFGLNDFGDAAGENPSFGPTIWFAGGATGFYTSALGAENTFALSTKYRMVGSYVDPSGLQKPWTSLKGNEESLPVNATEQGAAADVNNCGWVVGWSYFSGAMRGTLWQPAQCD